MNSITSIQNMNLEWVKTFVIFRESKDIFETAQKLHLTQPAVTQHLQKFQDSFDRPLFERIGKKKLLTPLGEEIYQQLSKDLHQLHRSLHQLQLQQADHQKIILRLGLQRDILQRTITSYQFSGKLLITTGTSQELWRKLLENQVDLISTIHLHDSTDYLAKKWFLDEFHFVIPKKWECHSLSDLKNLLIKNKIIMHQRSLPIWEKVAHHFQISFEQLSISMILDEWSSLLHYLEHSSMISLIPSSFSIPKGFKIIPAPLPLPKTQFYLAYHKQAKRIPRFIDFLHQLLQSTPLHREAQN